MIKIDAVQKEKPNDRQTFAHISKAQKIAKNPPSIEHRRIRNGITIPYPHHLKDCQGFLEFPHHGSNLKTVQTCDMEFLEPPVFKICLSPKFATTLKEYCYKTNPLLTEPYLQAILL